MLLPGPLGHGRTAQRRGWALAGVAVLLACLYLAPEQDNTFERVVRWGVPALVVFLVTLWGFGTQPLSPRWTLLGDASYSLYLFHPYIVQVLDKKLHAFDPAHGVRRWLMMAVVPLVCATFAVALYRAVEQPITAALRRWCFTPRPPQAGPSTLVLAQEWPGALRRWRSVGQQRADGHAIQRQQPDHMADGHARFARFDAGNGLHVHAQAGGGGGLAFTGSAAGLFGHGTQSLDGVEGVVADVRGDAFALRHGAGLSPRLQARPHSSWPAPLPRR
jgi:hypothetical protein